MKDSPIEAYLDHLLIQARTDARTTRRMLDETADHLMTTAAELEDGGLTRYDAEVAAVRQFGPSAQLTRPAHRQSVYALVEETTRAAVLLGGCGLAAIGASGLVALAMNVLLGRSFVGGATVLGGTAHSTTEVADDAVVLRVLAGAVGVLLLVVAAAWRRTTRRAPRVLPPGLVDALGAAAFAAGTLGLCITCVDQAVQTGARGVGFALSGALVALPLTVWFCVRAARSLLQPEHAHEALTVP